MRANPGGKYIWALADSFGRVLFSRASLLWRRSCRFSRSWVFGRDGTEISTLEMKLPQPSRGWEGCI
jgi:hypothetical protein